MNARRKRSSKLTHGNHAGAKTLHTGRYVNVLSGAPLHLPATNQDGASYAGLLRELNSEPKSTQEEVWQRLYKSLSANSAGGISPSCVKELLMTHGCSAACRV